MNFSIISLGYLLAILICLVDEAPADGELFKINKLNLIWSKAQHSLGSTKLKDLKNDLTKQEIQELALKKMKAHNQDKDGLFEADIRKKLLSILRKYSLERYYDDIHPSNTKVKDLDVDVVNQKPIFKDKKLDKLWRKAEQSGFTQEQLMILHEEFEHQQEKLDEHYDTMNHLEQEIERKAKSSDPSENSLEENQEKPKESQAEKKLRLESNHVHQSLKDKYVDIKKNYDKLHKKVVDPIGGPFEEEIVNKLWLAAQDAKFSEKDLESLKDELSHYETRIKKLKHFENQLERDTIGSKDTSSSTDELKHIHKRVSELSNKVEKSQKSLEKKIAAKRDEL